MRNGFEKRRKFTTGITVLNIDSLELTLSIIETYGEMEIGRYSAIVPNPFRIENHLEFHLN